MAKLIGASICLTKIDKTKITEKDGLKYLKITISVNDEPDKFGNDVSIIEAQTTPEREAKKPKVYLGNGKTFWTNEKKTTSIDEVVKEMQAEKDTINNPDISENLPF